MEKQTLAVIFGGQSSEHEVSCMSVQNVLNLIDTDRYEVLLIGITKEGRWLKVEDRKAIASDEWKRSAVSAIISPDAVDKCVLLNDGKKVEKKKIDIVFPVLHGLYGEDGTIQGLCELAHIPYVGCGVLSSAVTMDKTYTKIIVESLGIRQARYVPVFAHMMEKREEYIAEIEKKLGYPVFVKPSCGGSSCGVSCAYDREALIAGLDEASKYDNKILVEELIRGREVECAVLGGGENDIQVSGVGEILAAAEFYDYDAKYNNSESRTVINPDLPQEAIDTIRKESEIIFRAVDGRGLSRVDFFVSEDGKVVFNEINTIPGFTNISMYPMLWEAAGISRKDLVQKLIDLAH